MKSLTTILVLPLFFLLINISTSAQTLEQVYEKYNNAVQLVNTNAAEAVKNMEEAITGAKALGADAEEILVKAESQLPAMYFKLAGDLFKEKKNDEAIKVFEQSMAAGEKFNDASTVARSKDILGKLYFARANNFYRANENEKAVEALNQSLLCEPKNARAHMMLGLIYRKQEDLEKMSAEMDKAIEMAKAARDEQTAATCEKSMRDYLAIKANRSIQANKNSDAVEFLNRALNYGEDGQTYYLLALVQNKLKQYDHAIESARKALVLEADNVNEKPKIWFEIGNAYKEKGNTREACDAYKNAASGNFQKQAEYQMQQVLKCS